MNRAVKYFLSMIAALPAFPVSAADQLSEIAAEVNGAIITKKEVIFHMAPIVSMLRSKYPRQGERYLKAHKASHDEVLERLIDNAVVLGKLEELGMKVSDAEIDEEVSRIIRALFNGSEKEFQTSLELSGMDLRSFREAQRKKILIQEFRQKKFGGDVGPVTDAEIEVHFRIRGHDLRNRAADKITFRKIFIPALNPDTPTSTPKLQLALAEKIASKVKGGADFAETAIENSAGAFAQQGGLWENESRVDLEAEYGDIMFDTPEGQTVGPLKHVSGFIIVKVIKKTYGPEPELDKIMKVRMRTEIEIGRRSARYNEWLAPVKRTAKIKRHL